MRRPPGGGPRRFVPPPPSGFVTPKVGDTVWYYFVHAFWDVPMADLLRHRIDEHDTIEDIKRWRFTGRTELRSRIAIVKMVHDWRSLRVAPEYNSDDRMLGVCSEGAFARLAPRQVSSDIHSYRALGQIESIGRIVNGVLPRSGTWGFDPLPPIGGGR